MDTVDLAHANEHLEDLIARAAKGEVVYSRDPVLGTVKVGPAEPAKARPKRVIGQWKDKFEVPARLFEPLTDEELSWLSVEQSP